MVQLALEPLWRAYEACAPGADARSVLERMVKGLGLEQVPMATHLLECLES